MKKVAMYIRVSTNNQSTEPQSRELERVAAAKGWEITCVYEDAGVSGAKGRDERPQFDRMLKDAVRAKYDVLMVWAVDRMGRSLSDLCSTRDDLHNNGVDLYIHQQAIDTTTPSGKAMYQMIGVFAEFERSMIQQRVRAGLERAKANGQILGRPVGASSIPQRKRDQIVKSISDDGMSYRKCAKQYEVSLSTVQRLIGEHLE